MPGCMHIPCMPQPAQIPMWVTLQSIRRVPVGPLQFPACSCLSSFAPRSAVYFGTLTAKNSKMRSKSLLQSNLFRLNWTTNGSFSTSITCQKDFLLCPGFNNMYTKHPNTLNNIPGVHSLS